jgi:aspartate kinase
LKPTIVLKFGGTSLANRQRVGQVASIVLRKKASGHRIVVVVSARAGQTDSFIDEARSFSPCPSQREVDMLLSSGERISAAILSIALNAMGCPAVALTGSQAGIITDDNFTNARIIEIRPYRVLRALDEERVAVVGGFQGVSINKEITTLGRGGSDVTAVALASALDAAVCEIYSDVEGVFSADPGVVKEARRLDELSYQEMQEMGEAGARVLHPGSVEFAKIKNTVIHAKCTAEPEGAGSIIRNIEGQLKPRVVGVASEAKIVLLQTGGMNGIDQSAFGRLMDFFQSHGVKTKQVSFSPGLDGGLSGSLILPEKENYHIESVLENLRHSFDRELRVFRNYSAVSLIGTGITERYEYLRRTLALMRDGGIPVAGLHTSSFRISLLTDRSRLIETIRLLHGYFIAKAEVPPDEAIGCP